MYNKKQQHPIPSRTSPKNSSRGCLCSDGSYSVDCCDGSLIAQGIGNITADRSNWVVHQGQYVTYKNHNVTHS